MDIGSIISIVIGLAAGWLARGLLRARTAAPKKPLVGISRKPWRGSDRTALEILEHMSEGVVVLESDLRPVFVNGSARLMLGLGDDGLPRHLPSPQVTEAIRRALGGTDNVEMVETAYPARALLRVQVQRLDDGDVMAVLKDVSQEAQIQGMRREFVAHASHELKTPVTSVQTLAEAILQAVDDDPVAARRFATKLLSEAERLGKLVSDLLDLSRLEEPGAPSDEDCDLSEVVQAEVAGLRELAASKNVTLETSIEPDLGLLGDAQQLALLVRNLVENGIRYTPEGGSVWVSARRSSSWLLLRVEDSGIGIPRDAQGRVFERFYRVDKGRARLHGGTGLGLAIVKHVAELHGATIELQSEVGQGSVFEVWFKPAPVHEVPERHDAERHEDETKESA